VSAAKRGSGLWLVLLAAGGGLWSCSDEAREPGAAPLGAAGALATGGSAASGGAAPLPSPPMKQPVATPDSSEGNPDPTDLVGAGGAPSIGPGADAGRIPGAPPVFAGAFILGADISSADEATEGGSVFVDTDGVEKPLLVLLQNHGFNYIRLRTFVDPQAPYGYASGDGCTAKAEPFADKAHTIAFAQQIKAAGLGFLLDLHYSDTWADPAKQVIPEAWRELGSIEALAEQVRVYTVEVVSELVSAGARPDMVQVGNEITPGMLIHVPTANSDCYGNNSVQSPGVNGSQSDWDNLAMLLRAGVDGVRSVDPTIQIMLHVENTESAAGVTDWVQNARERGVELDVLGLSAYEAFQGRSSAWRATFAQLAQNLPELSFAVAEYNPQRRLLNDIMRELPDGRGLGTFFWEPTQSGSWGEAMFTWQGNRASANAADFAEYDQMRLDFAP
jgi:arabinogalactan endo-1,4-beta-galactosidase